jgi:predicted HTH domain antitoxin
MMTPNLHIPEDALRAVQVDLQAAAADVRIAAGMKLFELGRLSSGAAALLAGVSRVEFLDRLAEFGVNAFEMTEEELASDCGNV